MIFLNKESKSTKKNFCPFFLKGWGGGARLSDFLKRRKQILKKNGGGGGGAAGGGGLVG